MYWLRERECQSERFVPHFAEQDGKFCDKT
jgi:hypothetical protein